MRSYLWYSCTAASYYHTSCQASHNISRPSFAQNEKTENIFSDNAAEFLNPTMVLANKAITLAVMNQYITICPSCCTIALMKKTVPQNSHIWLFMKQLKQNISVRLEYSRWTQSISRNYLAYLLVCEDINSRCLGFWSTRNQLEQKDVWHDEANVEQFLYLLFCVPTARSLKLHAHKWKSMHICWQQSYILTLGPMMHILINIKAGVKSH